MPPHLYAYDRESIIEAMRAKGYADSYLSGLSRNASGTRIIARGNQNKAAYVFSIGGSAVPAVVANPASGPFWLDDDGQLVAWTDGSNSNNTILTTGQVIRGQRGASRGFDDGGRYYYERTWDAGRVVVFDVAKPAVPLCTYQTKNRLDGLTIRNGVLYFLEFDFHEGRQLYRLIKPTTEGCVEIDQILLPHGLWVVDMDPWSDFIILTEWQEFHVNNTYLFDTKSRKNIDLGAVTMGAAFFLAGDVLGADRLSDYK